MNHKQKIKFAKMLRTPKEEEDRVPIFQSSAWLRRKEAIAKRVKNQGKKIKA